MCLVIASNLTSPQSWSDSTSWKIGPQIGISRSPWESNPVLSPSMISVPDVTLISRRSGGKYQYQSVKENIEGERTGLLSQGDREMPIWGPIFHEVESDQDWGEVRLDAITRHIDRKSTRLNSSHL